jgi:predicted N-acetyltransferase YhbS
LKNKFTIRESTIEDLDKILKVELEAFGPGEGPEIIQLVNNLFNDPTAEPLLSLVAMIEGEIEGHILFTSARVGSREKPVVSILAPLAVAPDLQKQGIGGRLITEGLAMLSQRGFELVFVLGHPGYYPRYGFQVAGSRGYTTPYPLPAENADAWMFQELKAGAADRYNGRVSCAAALDRAEYWS